MEDSNSFDTHFTVSPVNEDSIPVAVVDGGSRSNEIIYLEEGQPLHLDLDSQDLIHENLLSLADDIICNYDENRHVLNGNDREALRESVATRVPPTKGKLKSYYHRACQAIDESLGKEIILDGPILLPIPNVYDDDENPRIYVSGGSGCGKSTWINNWLSLYMQYFPKAKVFIFSKLHSDKNLDFGFDKYFKSGQFIRVPLDDSIKDMEIDAESFPPRSVVIFDDIGTLRKDIKKEVMRIRDDVLQIGRHSMLAVISVCHNVLNWQETKASINESNIAVIFPRSNRYAYGEFLKKYLGLEPQLIAKIMGLRSRSAYISKNFPRFVVYDSGCFLLDNIQPCT